MPPWHRYIYYTPKCLKTKDDILNVRLSLGMFSSAHSLSSHSVSAAWERGHLKVSRRWRVNAAIDLHLATLMHWLNSLLTVCTVWLWNMHPCSLLGWMISFIIICWLCLLQLVVTSTHSASPLKLRPPSCSVLCHCSIESVQTLFNQTALDPCNPNFYFQSTVINSKAQFSSKHWSDVYVCIATSSVGYWSEGPVNACTSCRTSVFSSMHIYVFAFPCVSIIWDDPEQAPHVCIE